jgi:hypothetical protein
MTIKIKPIINYEELNDDDLYAYVEGDAIIEFPITGFHIKNRGHNPNVYVPVTRSPKPIVQWYQTLEQSAYLRPDGTVIEVWTVKSKDLSLILRKFYKDPNWHLNPKLLNISGIAPEDRPERVHIANVAIDDILIVKAEISNFITNYIESKAKALGYDNLLSLLSYADSSNKKYRVEARAAKYLRDKAWEELEFYQGEILTAQVPIPCDTNEILEHVRLDYDYYYGYAESLDNGDPNTIPLFTTLTPEQQAQIAAQQAAEAAAAVAGQFEGPVPYVQEYIPGSTIDENGNVIPPVVPEQSPGLQVPSQADLNPSLITGV